MNKYYSLKKLIQLTKKLKKKNKKICLTHGAFDLFHIGHLRLLQKSKEICDFLIVGVDSNLNIKKYKGPKRSIINAKDRIALIS